MTWQDRLKTYGKDQNAGWKEVERAKNVYAQKSAAGDKAGANQANKWANQVRGAMGVSHLFDTYGRPKGYEGFQAMQPKSQQFQAPQYNQMSYQDAIKRSQQRLNPMYDQARTNAGVQNQQQANLLAQRLNARGMADGGANVQGQIDLSAQLQQVLGNIDTGYNTQQAEMAEALMMQDREAEDRAFARALQEFGTNRGVLESDRGFNRGVWESDRNFGLQQDQANWGKQMDQANLTGNFNGQRTLQGSQFDWSKALGESQLTGMYDGAKTWDRELAERQLAFNQAKEARIGSGGGSGGGFRGSSRGSVSKPKPPTSQEQKLQAQETIQNRIGAFYRPVDFMAQIEKEFKAGQMDPYTYKYIKDYLEDMFDEETAFQPMRPKKGSWNDAGVGRK